MPAIRSILLHLDASLASEGRLVLAHALAARHGARVTALFGVGVPTDAAVGTFAYSASAALIAAEARGSAHEPVRTRLREQATGGDAECLWCDVAGDSLVHGVVAESAYADVLIVGPPVVPGIAGSAPPGFVESVILGSGAPTVVVPHPHLQQTLGDRVLVAWDGSPHAARALRAAVPLIGRGAQVHVATWGVHPPVAPFSHLDAVGWLGRHGIAAELHRHDASPHVADALMTLAARLRADLVVMGCYGHSRVRERWFGGVTRSVLATSTMPLLMAH